MIVKTPEGYYSIDLPYCTYETQKGFMQWKKIPDVQFSPEDIEIVYLGEEDYYWPEPEEIEWV